MDTVPGVAGCFNIARYFYFSGATQAEQASLPAHPAKS
jgi:hypothetical protein